MKRKIGLSRSVSPIAAIIVIGIMTVVSVGSAVGYDRVFNVENYYEAQEQSLGGEVHNAPETFDAGIKVNGTEIINSSGEYTGAFNGSTITTSGAISGATTVTAGTLVSITDGYLSVNDVGASGTAASLVGKFYRSCATTGDFADGCNDGDYPYLEFGITNDDTNGTSLKEATSTCQIRVYADETASSSLANSFEIWCKNDSTGTFSNWFQLDSGAGTFSGALNVTGATTLTGALTGSSGIFNSSLTAEAITGSSTLAISGEAQMKRVVLGGSVAATTSAAVSEIMQAADFCDYSAITYTLANTVDTINITLPASSTLAADCLDTLGDSQSIMLYNLNSVAASTTVIVAGAGIKLEKASTTSATLAGGNIAEITIQRVSETTGKEFFAFITPFKSDAE